MHSKFMNNKVFLLIIVMFTNYSCQRWDDAMSRKPIDLSEVIEGGFFFELKGSWSYIKLSEQNVPDNIKKDTVQNWKYCSFYQIIYDFEKDSIFRLNGYFPWFFDTPYGITFYPFYVLKGETSSYNTTSKERSRFYSLSRGLKYKFTLGVDYNFGRYYRYVKRKPFKVWKSEKKLLTE